MSKTYITIRTVFALVSSNVAHGEHELFVFPMKGRKEEADCQSFILGQSFGRAVINQANPSIR